MYEGLVFAVVVPILGSALILRSCRPGPHQWPARRSWFDLT